MSEDQKSKLTSFKQIMDAFGGWSPGGLFQDGVLYVRRSDCISSSDPDEVVAHLNSLEMVGSVRRVELVDEFPTRGRGL